MANKNRRRYKKGKTFKKILREKLGVMIIIILLAFGGLCVRLVYITRDNQESYQKKILTQQRYDSTTLPFKRGTITDRNGTILAVSEKVYNVVLDCKVMLDDERSKEPTLSALAECFGLSRSDLDAYVENNPNSQYYVLKKRLTYDEISPFLDKEKEVAAEAAEFNKTADSDNQKGVINGVWFEEEYTRRYPNNSLACDVIGFTGTDNNGTYGLEEYYNDELNGTNGREYGYLNDDATLERTTIAAVDGHSLVSTVDANIQAIAEKYILQFNEEYRDAAREGAGSYNTGCIIMNPNNGEILAMATDNPYDLNNPRDLTSYYSQDEINGMDNDTMLENLYGIWKNYCISDAFEPGSTVKPLTIGAALDADVVQPSDTFVCDGYQMFGGTRIRCSIYPGAHGTETLSDLIKHSCNDGLMQIGALLGPEEFLKYQKIFNFGATTGIDLPGEATGILHTEESLSSGSTELASASFGQGYTCTMIQEIAAICSVINGGYYYQPHVVSKILNEDGDVIKDVQPVVTKQTVSSDVSALIRQYMGTVMESDGTGAAAKVDGYSMGGKTGTAQKYPREDKKYLVSFIGFAPLDDPQVVVYVVVDEPNTEYQADSLYAQYIYKGVMTEILPYLNIFQDEEVTDKANAKMTYLENLINQQAESNRQSDSTDDTTTAAPPEDDSETKLDNKQESEGITDEEAAIQSGN